MLEYWNKMKDKKAMILLNLLFLHSIFPLFQFQLSPR